MLMVCFLPDRVFTQKLLDLGEEIVLLIIMMRLDKLKPGLRIANKISLVGIFDVGSLEVDGVKASNNGVVQKGHVSGSCGEKIGLQR
jgi:hypothetical protein